jgi:hypothetical protein
MLDYLKENKGLAAIVILVVLGVGGYFAYRSSSSDALLSSSSTATETSQVSRELLLTISDLKTITLDNSIFTDEAFVSLVDFRVDIPLQPVGRDNPFAPLTPRGTRAR